MPHLRLAALGLGAGMLLLAQQTVMTPQKLHAKGTFTVNVRPLATGPSEGTARFSLEKQIHGDLEGISQGEMLTAGDPTKGIAGYVAMETVSGTLNGKKGSFVLQHTATMDQDGQKMSIVITPGSGSGELKGIAGIFEIQIVGGNHSYTLDYTLP